MYVPKKSPLMYVPKKSPVNSTPRDLCGGCAEPRIPKRPIPRDETHKCMTIPFDNLTKNRPRIQNNSISLHVTLLRAAESQFRRSF